MIYQRLLRPLLFRMDPEWIHDQTITWGERAQWIPGLCRTARRRFDVVDPRLHIRLAGIECPNPVGLAAGFDKSGRVVPLLASLGFGHLEIGSVSAEPSAGNPQPRLWRLPDDQAVCVHYGLPNEGAAVIADRLATTHCRIPLGINLVNTNHGSTLRTPTPDEILDDYIDSALRLKTAASYLMLNLSCPNTKDGRDFFDQADHLTTLLQRLSALPIDRPVFLKISPDYDDVSLDRLLETVDPHEFVKGFMFNLSPRRRDDLATARERWRALPGAISGAPCKRWTDPLVANLYRRMDRQRYQIIAAGGVQTAEDAYQKLLLGASAVQVYTALIYHGPDLVRRINRGLIRILEREGLRQIRDAVGQALIKR